MSKEYFIRVCHLEWGLVERPAENYKEALSLYAYMKERYKEVPCLVQLVSATIDDEGNETERVLHEKEVGKHNNPIYHVDMLIEHAEAIIEACSSLNTIAAHNTILMRDFTHGIELSRMRKATVETRLQILDELEDVVTERRQAKLVHSDILEILENIKEVRKYATHSKKQLNASLTKRIHLNRSLKNNNSYDKYMDSLGVHDKVINDIANPYYFSPKYIEEDNIEGVVIAQEDNRKEIEDKILKKKEQIVYEDLDSNGFSVGDILKQKLKIG